MARRWSLPAAALVVGLAAVPVAAQPSACPLVAGDVDGLFRHIAEDLKARACTPTDPCQAEAFAGLLGRELGGLFAAAGDHRAELRSCVRAVVRTARVAVREEGGSLAFESGYQAGLRGGDGGLGDTALAYGEVLAALEQAVPMPFIIDDRSARPAGGTEQTGSDGRQAAD